MTFPPQKQDIKWISKWFLPPTRPLAASMWPTSHLLRHISKKSVLSKVCKKPESWNTSTYELWSEIKKKILVFLSKKKRGIDLNGPEHESPMAEIPWVWKFWGVCIFFWKWNFQVSRLERDNIFPIFSIFDRIDEPEVITACEGVLSLPMHISVSAKTYNFARNLDDYLELLPKSLQKPELTKTLFWE